jgi:hypothetical protein
VSCSHKIPSDFHAGKCSDGRTTWRCSHCGRAGPWALDWSYDGTIGECKHCGWQIVQAVACSDACAKALGAKSEPPRESAKLRKMAEELRNAGYIVAPPGTGEGAP